MQSKSNPRVMRHTSGVGGSRTKIAVYVVRLVPSPELALVSSAHNLGEGVGDSAAPALTEHPLGDLKPGEWWRLALRPVVLFVLSRLGVLGLMGATTLSTRHRVLTQLLSWDSKWYLMVAARGYVHAIPPGTGNAAQSDLGFFPLVPLLIRAVHVATGLGFAVAGLVTTSALGLFAAVAVWFMLYNVFGRNGADRGTALVVLSPAAFVFSMVYSEGAIILFAALSLIALQHRRWILAGLCAAAATAADPVGAAAIVPCVVAAVMAVRSRGEWRALLAPIIAPAGIATFFIYLWLHTGSPLTWFDAQRAGWQGGNFGTSVFTAVVHVVEHGFQDPNYVVKTIGVVIAGLLVVFFFRAHPPAPWVGYVVAVLAFGLASPVIGITPRLLLRSFPLLGVVGARLPPIWFELVLAISTMALAVLTVASASTFWTP